MEQAGFVIDPAQQCSVVLLDGLYQRVVEARPTSWWRGLLSRHDKWSKIKGLYFWGGVGRGKTLLMDIFYQSLPAEVPSERTHFHSFMNRVHASLQQHGNIENPLQQVARDIAAKTRVLCLDEFVIIDIGDAMIMAGLLEALFAERVVLVTTSNAAPGNLYHDGLQRARFQPAIDLIARNCDVVNLDGDQDYRLRFLQQTDLYSVPHNAENESRIRDYLDQHVAPMQTQQQELNINGRVLAHQYCAEDTVWFSFAQLCETTRSQNDYLELARFFNTLILTDIRQMDKSSDDVARRFVLLIDVLYDHHVKLICSAADRPDQLYLGKRLRFEFERTASRLIEMQSQEYLAQAHSLQ
jgi:cell division protein ZapE